MTIGQRTQLARWLEGDGIEIGALHQPLPVPEGARVTYVDRLDEAGLREHYPELAGSRFAPVSVIGSAEDLSAFADRSLDFVIANHLVEHLEYPIRGLLEFRRVLKPGGILYMALPDRRLTFDRDREPTPLEHLLEEHRHGAEANRRAHYLEWANKVDGKQGREAEAHADALLESGYSIHFHVWTPDSFIDFLVAARREAGLDLQLLEFGAAEVEGDFEFILVLAREGDRVRLAPARSAQPQAADGQPPPSIRTRLARSPIGPPVRAVKRSLRRLGPGQDKGGRGR